MRLPGKVQSSHYRHKNENIPILVWWHHNLFKKLHFQAVTISSRRRNKNAATTKRQQQQSDNNKAINPSINKDNNKAINQFSIVLLIVITVDFIVVGNSLVDNSNYSFVCHAVRSCTSWKIEVLVCTSWEIE